MMYVLWGLLNFVLLVFFIRAVSQAVLILNKELSRLSLVILLLGVFSYAYKPGSKPEKETASWKNKEITTLESLPVGWRHVVAEDRLTNTRKVDFLYGKDSLGNRVIAKALWTDTGIELFTRRYLQSFNVYHSDFKGTEQWESSLKGPFYEALVAEDWYLLGFKVNSNNRWLRGSIPLK